MKKFEMVVEYKGSKTVYVEAENRDKAKEIAVSGFQTDYDECEDIEIANCVVTDYWE